MQQIHFGNLMAPKAWPEGGDVVVVCLMSPRQVIEFASGLKINKEPLSHLAVLGAENSLSVIRGLLATAVLK